jgi:hypothetical protein
MKPESRTVRALLVVASTGATLLAFAAAAQAAPVPPPAPDTAWLLDEGSGSLLADYDSARGGQLGGPTSPTFSTDTPFAYAGDYSLEFVASGSAGGNWAEINGHPSGTQGTVSFWVRDDNGGAPSYILDASGGDRTLMYRTPAGGNFGVYVNNTSIGGVDGSIVPVPPNSQWTHVAIVWDNTDPTQKERIYQNGVLFQTANVTLAAKNPVSVFLGSRQSRNETWGGKIDEYALWNTPLSADQVEWLAGNSLRSIPRAEPAAPNAAWLFDEGAGTTAFDHVGSNNGTLHGSVSWSDKTPYAMYLGDNHSLRFDGLTNGTNVTFGAHSFGTEGSIQMWVYADWDVTQAGWRYLMDGSNGDRVILAHNGPDSWGLYLDNQSVGSITGLIHEGEWTHVAITWDDSLPTQKQKVYRNGVLFASFNSSTIDAFNPSTLWLGSRYTNNEGFIGWIDEFALFDHALSGYDIEQYYRASLVGIPEPATFVLMGLGGVFLAGLGCRRRRRRV